MNVVKFKSHTFRYRHHGPYHTGLKQVLDALPVVLKWNLREEKSLSLEGSGRVQETLRKHRSSFTSDWEPRYNIYIYPKILQIFQSIANHNKHRSCA
jgi:hypothetical protein